MATSGCTSSSSIPGSFSSGGMSTLDSASMADSRSEKASISAASYGGGTKSSRRRPARSGQRTRRGCCRGSGPAGQAGQTAGQPAGARARTHLQHIGKPQRLVDTVDAGGRVGGAGGQAAPQAAHVPRPQDAEELVDRLRLEIALVARPQRGSGAVVAQDAVRALAELPLRLRAQLVDDPDAVELEEVQDLGRHALVPAPPVALLQQERARGVEEWRVVGARLAVRPQQPPVLLGERRVWGRGRRAGLRGPMPRLSFRRLAVPVPPPAVRAVPPSSRSRAM